VQQSTELETVFIAKYKYTLRPSLTSSSGRSLHGGGVVRRTHALEIKKKKNIVFLFKTSGTNLLYNGPFFQKIIILDAGII
jgi:hypothetical protein